MGTPDSQRVIVEDQAQADALAALFARPEVRELRELTIEIPRGGFSLSGLPAGLHKLAILGKRRDGYHEDHLHEVLASVARAGLAELRELDISIGWYTDARAVDALAPILAGGCPALESLAFDTECADLTRLFLERLISGPVLPRLARLRLDTIDDEGAQLILGARAQFSQLTELDLFRVVGQHRELTRFRVAGALPQFPNLADRTTTWKLRDGELARPEQALETWVPIPACAACRSEAVEIVSCTKAEQSPFANNESVGIDWEVHCSTCHRRTLWSGWL